MLEQDNPAADDQRIAILDALGLSLASKLADAKAARAACGIEQTWEEDEAFYQGYDDANKHEFTNVTRKPLAGGGSSEPIVKRKGSTVFPNITQPYVDAAAARVGDMLLPTDERNWAIEHTPIPDMLPEDEAPQMQQPDQPMPGMPAPQGAPPGQPQAAAPQAPLAAPPRMIQMPDGTTMSLVEAQEKFKKYKAEATRKAEKAQDRIDDWLTESHANSEIRMVIDDAAKLGSGVLKGPVPVNCKQRMWKTLGDNTSALVIVEEIKPASKRVDVWNLFPDYPACGENIHDGSFVFERDFLTSKRLKELKGLPGYLDAQIDLCLEEEPEQAAGDDRQQAKKGQYEVNYFYGSITAEELDAAGCSCEDESESYPVMLTLVNGRVIRAALNPLDSGEFPYDLIPWKRRPGMPWGMGVARQMRTPQRIVVAATRNMMDNAGQGSGPQFVVRRGVEPLDGKWEITPLKIWRETDESDGQAGPPFLTVIVPMLQAELSAIVLMGMKMAEDVTGMPQLMQGQQGTAPDTVGGMNILNNNANAVLRRIARLFDSCITEPHISRYYAWLMEYGEDDDEKGDFVIVARGSSALVERDIQSQEMANVVSMTLNPAFGKDPKKAMDEFLKSRRFDPGAFDYSEEDKAKMEAQPPQPPPQIAVAQIRAESDQKVAAMRAKEEADHAAADAQLAMNQMKFEQQENELDRQNKLAIAVIDERMKSTELTSAERNTLSQIKSQLAQTSMKLNVQKDLSLAAHTVDLHKSRTSQVVTPPSEPVGRAATGQAFAQ